MGLTERLAQTTCFQNNKLPLRWSDRDSRCRGCCPVPWHVLWQAVAPAGLAQAEPLRGRLVHSVLYARLSFLVNIQLACL